MPIIPNSLNFDRGVGKLLFSILRAVHHAAPSDFTKEDCFFFWLTCLFRCCDRVKESFLDRPRFSRNVDLRNLGGSAHIGFLENDSTFLISGFVSNSSDQNIPIAKNDAFFRFLSKTTMKFHGTPL